MSFPTYPPEAFSQGHVFAKDPPPPAEPWKGPCKVDATDLAKQKAEQERLAAANRPAPPPPPPRPVPTSIEECRVLIEKHTAEPTPIDQAAVTARASNEWRTTRFNRDAPGGNVGRPRKLQDVVAENSPADHIGMTLLEKLVAERLARRQLQETVRDLVDVVNVLVKRTPTPAESEAAAEQIGQILKEHTTNRTKE